MTGIAKGGSPTMARALPQGDPRSMRNPLVALGQAGTAPGNNGGASARQPSAGSGLSVGNGVHKPLDAFPSRGSYGARPTSAQSHGAHASLLNAPQRPLSAQSSNSQGKMAKPDLRRWTDEDLRRQIQLLEKGLKCTSGGAGGGSSSSAGPRQASAVQAVPAEAVSTPTVPMAPIPVTAASSLIAGFQTSGASSPSPAPPEFTEDREGKRSPGRDLALSPSPETERIEEALSLKERQVVELRAQIARREKQFSTRGRQTIDGTEAEHPDPERTGPPAIGSSANVPPLSAGLTGGAPAATNGPGSATSLERLVSGALGERVGSASAGANTPGGTLPSTPGGRDTSQLEGELAWIVKQMECHRRQISEHQQKLAALEKRHAEIITALSSHGIGGVRSPASTNASTLAERHELLDDGAVGFDAITARLGLHKELLEAASGDSSMRREGIDDPLAFSMNSSSLSASTAARALERADRALRGLHHTRGSSRPTSAGSGTSAGSREVASRSTRTSSGNPFAPKVGLDALGRAPRSSTGSSAGSAAPGLDGIGNEPPRSFGKSYEAERIVYLLTQFGMKRPLRVPFVPLDAAAEGEGRPYLHGALEVRLCLSDDGNRLMVRVGSGATGVGGRLFEMEEFVNRAETIEARRSQRPMPIAEEGAHQVDQLNDSIVSSRASGTPDLAAATAADSRSGESLFALLGRNLKDTDAGASSLPWKKLFKSHWSTG